MRIVKRGLIEFDRKPQELEGGKWEDPINEVNPGPQRRWRRYGLAIASGVHHSIRPRFLASQAFSAETDGFAPRG